MADTAKKPPIRTVIVDDEAEARDLLRFRLEIDGVFEVVGEAGNGPDGVAVCVEQQPDIVILDAAMPDGDGLPVVPHIRHGSPHTIVLIYTSATGIKTRDEAEKVGAHAVVGKLDPFELLLGTVFRFLPDRAPADHLKQDRDEFGHRMTELLDKDDPAADAGGRRKKSTRVWLVVLLVVVALPLLAFLAWLIGQLAGWGLSL